MGRIGETNLLDARAADRIAAAAEAAAQELGVPISLAVVDAGGHLMLFRRMDGAVFGSVRAAQEKAWSAIAFERPTKAFDDGVHGGRVGLMRLPGAFPMEGGVELRRAGRAIGAIGVAGGSSAEDGAIAARGAGAMDAP